MIVMKTALITGISKGIGKAICEKLIADGYFVHGTYNTGKAEAENLKQHLKNLEIHKVDLSNRSELLEFISQLKEIKFDAIVNNAGMIEFEVFEEYDMRIWDKTLEVNLSSILVICTGLQKNLNPKASIVNIASTDGMTGTFVSMAYAASKAALINLTKSLGNNFGKFGMRVNAISPGWIDTTMSDQDDYTEKMDETTFLNPLSRNGLPSEVAEVTSFLLSEKSSYINGANIVIDGGYTNVDYIMKKEASQN